MKVEVRYLLSVRYVHGYNSNLVMVLLLEQIPLHGTNASENIFCELEKILDKCEFPLNKYVFSGRLFCSSDWLLEWACG
jgi:hypothetical protein